MADRLISRRIVSALFTLLLPLIAAPVSALGAAPADECDRLAQPPKAVLGKLPSYADGVAVDKIDGPAALLRCSKAMAAHPEEVRFTVWLGRALSSMGRNEDALQYYRTAADKGHPVAQNNLGAAYDVGQGVEKDHAIAVQWYRKAADQDLPVAEYNLGLAYDEGEGVAKDQAQAIQWYRKAADQGYPAAETNLGNIYGFGIGVEKDEAQAVQWFRKAAEQGYAPAQGKLGVYYEHGYGVAQDYGLALAWYQKAADQGDATGEYGLGQLTFNGKGVSPNRDLGIPWIRKSADHGFAVAQLFVGLQYAKGVGVKLDLEEAKHWFRLAAAQGNDEAKTELSALEAEQSKPLESKAVSQGGKTAPADECDRLAQPPKAALGRLPSFADGVAFDKIDGPAAFSACSKALAAHPDEVRFTAWLGRVLDKMGRNEEAVRYNRIAADQGDPVAQTNLAAEYSSGRGVPKDQAQAIQWLRKAADQGLPVAENNLALAYRNGNGVPKDDAQAAEWFRKAAEQGYTQAQAQLGEYYEHGYGVAQDYGLALTWYRKAADQGDMSAEYSVGRMYMNGTGVPPSVDLATPWIRKSADQGFAFAQLAVGQQYAKGVGVKLDLEEAKRWFRLAAEQGNAQAQKELSAVEADQANTPAAYAQTQAKTALKNIEFYQINAATSRTGRNYYDYIDPKSVHRIASGLVTAQFVHIEKDFVANDPWGIHLYSDTVDCKNLRLKTDTSTRYNGTRPLEAPLLLDGSFSNVAKDHWLVAFVCAYPNVVADKDYIISVDDALLRAASVSSERFASFPDNAILFNIWMANKLEEQMK